MSDFPNGYLTTGNKPVINDAYKASEEYLKEQRKQDNLYNDEGDIYESAINHAFIAGARWMKEQIMKDAIIAEVKEVADVRFPNEKNIVDKVFGAGNLEYWEYNEAKALVALAKEELLKDLESKEVDWEEKRMKECPFRQVGCKMYNGTILECKGACSWVVDYPKLKELETKKGQ